MTPIVFVLEVISTLLLASPVEESRSRDEPGNKAEAASSCIETQRPESLGSKEKLSISYFKGGPGESYSDETSFPVTVGPDLTHNGLTDAFVAKVNTRGTGLMFCG